MAWPSYFSGGESESKASDIKKLRGKSFSKTVTSANDRNHFSHSSGWYTCSYTFSFPSFLPILSILNSVGFYLSNSYCVQWAAPLWLRFSKALFRYIKIQS